MSKIHAISTPPASSHEQQRVQQTRGLIETLLSSLPPRERVEFEREIAARVGVPRPTRHGAVVGAVAKILPLKAEWSAAELKQRVDESGASTDPKDVYNAIEYLVRTGQVRRIAYGRYVVAGGGEIQTSDDLGGETARHEDAYRVDRGNE
jgi:hypothetical protein